ncbi:sugar phosphate isomerase/epimerase [Candidatus Woesearchaeota archaeon]|nr:sugar phosphate isomerase/epimerase [Candidatus Woesearchaeota archaeon]
MKIGVMNSPRENPASWVEWAGKNGFDFIDLTIEPPSVLPHQIDVKRLKALLRRYDLEVVGHMGDWRLAKESLYPCLREASKKEILNAIRTHKKLGAKKITIHAPNFPDIDFSMMFPIYSKLVGELLREAKKQGVTLMFENGGSNTKNHTRLIDALMRKYPSLGLHIDVGHANICVRKNLLFRFLKKHRKRVIHLHFSDNKGKADDHRHLGYGTVNWKKVVASLKKAGYDGTITLETFRSGKTGTLKSMKKLRKMWDSA